MANFYFDFRDIDKKTFAACFPYLLIQFSARSDRCHDILSKLYFKHDRGVRKPSDRDMVECLKRMLILESQVPIYIIMDGLDECPDTSTVPSPREEVLEFVKEELKLAFASQTSAFALRAGLEHDIQVVLKHLTVCPVSLHDESGQQEDIARYVASFVRSDRRMRRWRQEDKDLVIKTLSEKADGM